MMDLVLGPGEGGWLSRTFGGMMVNVAASAVLDMYRKYRPAIPIHTGLPRVLTAPALPISTSWAMFADGTAAAVNAAKARAREMGITLHGPMVASTIVAYFHAGRRPAEPGCVGGKPERVVVSIVSLATRAPACHTAAVGRAPPLLCAGHGLQPPESHQHAAGQHQCGARYQHRDLGGSLRRHSNCGHPFLGPSQAGQEGHRVQVHRV